MARTTSRGKTSVVIEQFLQIWIKALQFERDVSVRRKAISSLQTLKHPDAVGPLIQALSDKDVEIRRGAALALGEISSPQASDALIRVLADDAEDLGVREKVATALGVICTPKTVEALIDVIRQGNTPTFQDLENHAWLALFNEVRKPDPTIIDIMIQALSDPLISIRSVAASVLGHIGDKMAIDPLLERVLDSKEDDKVRQGAALAIGKLGASANNRAVKVLLEAMENPDVIVRRYAIIGLEECAGSLTTQQFIEYIKDKDAEIRASAISALRQFKDPSLVSVFLDALKDKDAGVRAQAARGLGGVGDTSAIAPLINAMKDPDAKVQGAANQALEEIDERICRTA